MAAVSCNQVPEEYLSMLESAASQAAAGLTAVEAVDPSRPSSSDTAVATGDVDFPCVSPNASANRQTIPRTIIRPTRAASPLFQTPVSSQPISYDDGDVEMPPVQRLPSITRHHNVPISSRGKPMCLC